MILSALSKQIILINLSPHIDHLLLNSGGAFGQPEYLITLIRVARDSSESSRTGISIVGRGRASPVGGGSIHSGGAQNKRIRKPNRKHILQEV